MRTLYLKTLQNDFHECGCCSSAAAIYKLIFCEANLRYLFESGTYWNAALIGASTVLKGHLKSRSLNCGGEIGLHKSDILYWVGCPKSDIIGYG